MINTGKTNMPARKVHETDSRRIESREVLEPSQRSFVDVEIFKRWSPEVI